MNRENRRNIAATAGFIAAILFLCGPQVHATTISLAPVAKQQCLVRDSWSLICSLLFGGSPPAIRWFVIAIVVGIAINRMLGRRPATHISDKVPKVIPTFADFYSAPTIVLELSPFGVIAARLHRTPYLIFWPSTLTGGRSMNEHEGAISHSYFAQQAVTASRLTRFQCMGNDGNSSAAFANTCPPNEPIGTGSGAAAVWSAGDRGQAAKSLSLKIKHICLGAPLREAFASTERGAASPGAKLAFTL